VRVCDERGDCGTTDAAGFYTFAVPTGLRTIIPRRFASGYSVADPVGPVADQPRFLNGAAVVETSHSARELLQLLLEIESEFGRTRVGPPGGPRTLDLDLLLYGDERIDEPGLQVPHPRLHERPFVLEPLGELGWTPSGRG
jgi:2-amino-4-hydroxy-6-hydroxymethyldihydropteridine diphosphokinase